MNINRLSARHINSLDPGFHSDGAGLYLRVRATGSRAWVFRFTRAGKVREIGLGPAHTRKLAEARKLAWEMRSCLADGEDPKSVVESRSRNEADHNETFKSCALSLIDAKKSGWRNAKHEQQWRNSLRDYAFPIVGSLHPKEIELSHVKDVLLPIWESKTETATRVRQRMEAVLDWAYVHGLRSGENPAKWRGVLGKVLSPPNKIRQVKHFAATPYEEVPDVFQKLGLLKSASVSCLRFVILNASRSSEARGAEWEEIDLTTGTWNIPGSRMKAGKRHAVPLCDEALAILRALPRFPGQPLIFPNPSGNRLSDVALGKALRSVRPGVTVHGFRSSFRQWAAERTNVSSEVCEIALAHVNKDRVEAAYQRSDLLEKRRELMEVWGRFLSDSQVLAKNHS